jgi:hypothetical protein
VLTKHDIGRLDVDLDMLDSRFDLVRAEMRAELAIELRRGFERVMLAMIWTLIGVGFLVIAAIKL